MKRIFWTGTSHDDLNDCPKSVRHAIGYALYLVQMGERPAQAKTLSGMGSAKIAEIRENDASGTYRAMYTLEMKDCVFVLHVFQKKSKTGKETPKKELDLLKIRLREARDEFKNMQETGKL
jgi:phage-related protein